MVPASTARRGHGRDGAEIDAGTRKEKANTQLRLKGTIEGRSWLFVDLAGVIGESFAPQDGEEACHVLRIEAAQVTVRARRGDEEHRRLDLWTIYSELWVGRRHLSHLGGACSRSSGTTVNMSGSRTWPQ